MTAVLAPRPLLRTGDTVRVLAGVDRGKDGKVLQVLPGEGRAVVEGVQKRKKHLRSRRDRQKGEVIEYNAPVDLSNLQLLCPRCHKPTRVAKQLVGERRVRACKQCKQPIDT